MLLDSPSITGKHLHERGSLSIFRSAMAFAECDWTGEFYQAGFGSLNAGSGDSHLWGAQPATLSRRAGP